MYGMPFPMWPNAQNFETVGVEPDCLSICTLQGNNLVWMHSRMRTSTLGPMNQVTVFAREARTWLLSVQMFLV